MSGEDDLRDVHIFRTDDRARALQMETLMRDVLFGVELRETGGASAAGGGPRSA